MNILALAYLGDAIYELYVREHIIKTVRTGRADIMHRAGVKYVCADGQADSVKAMIESGFLSEDEQGFVRRAHNHKTATKPKNADPVTYKWATAFEALLGYLRLSGCEQRLKEIMQKAVEITEGAEKQ